MKRQIKFRAWIKQEKQMVTQADFGEYSMVSNGDGFGIVEGISGYNHWLKKDDFEIMQYTGLKDKNGVEIFEGDVVRILYTDWPSNTDPNVELEDYLISISHVGEVIYQAPEFGILFFKENRYGERQLGSFNYGAHGRIEVIGNVYQNPELL